MSAPTRQKYILEIKEAIFNLLPECERKEKILKFIEVYEKTHPNGSNSYNYLRDTYLHINLELMVKHFYADQNDEWYSIWEDLDKYLKKEK